MTTTNAAKLAKIIVSCSLDEVVTAAVVVWEGLTLLKESCSGMISMT